MKLLTKTTIYFLLIMLPLLTVSAFYLFSQFNKQIRHEIDEELLNDQIQWIRYLDTVNLRSMVFHFSTPEFSLQPADGATQQKPVVQSVMLYQEVEGEKVPYRQLTQLIPIQGKTYLLTLRKSLIERRDLIKNIFFVMMIVFGGLLGFILLLNWLLSKRLWRPFYQSLEKVQGVQLMQLGNLRFSPTSTHEFSRLNAALNTMATRIHRDYISIKELTEDAAHEMQTPLAIAESKLEVLLQDESLSEAQLHAIGQSTEALERLSRLNHSLLQLAKIENHQYDKTQSRSLQQVTNQYLGLLDELIKDKQLTLDTRLSGPAAWQMPDALADMLVSNLLGNAIRYNYTGGQIRVQLDDQQLAISNTSDAPAIPENQLFQRFKKGTPVSDHSNGLGLAIVKKICDTYNLPIRYQFENGVHTFTVFRFSPDSTASFAA
ncbi:HAMP domain-containing histidine kinase [Chitinophaga agrisoli]|uniref:histidine kinase n=1 Tax=Chitinophaga agrisoli TaxID=2607653 RepID=A0A5B2VX91_9BACT|nr:HAMP domain-containing sensor histidine kinase [Chitinophaga agrisoli]KAA2243404.1 HAMP domain-containing histidine kinase [Chitinophaga agrisoli]